MVVNDADTCVPTQVTDFIFDLSDSVTLSQIIEEQTKLYMGDFRELCTKYFASSPWPSPQAIASECNGNPLFLAIYREVTHRHWHSVSRPSVRDRIEGWSVYRELFEEFLDEENVAASQSTFFLLADWSFDILHEFVYQFQGFCQFRAAVYASAKKHGVNIDGTGGSNPPHHLLENLTQLHHNKDAWAIQSVMEYLHRLIQVGKTSKDPGYQYLGIFSSIALSRLECLLGDYTGCLQAAQSMMHIVVHKEEPTVAAADIVQAVVGARLSLAYHAGVAYLMTRRYQMCISTLAEACSFLQRGFKTGQLRSKAGGEQWSKLYDRMLTLLAICTHICPPRNLEDALVRAIRETHGSQLGKLEASTSNPTTSSTTTTATTTTTTPASTTSKTNATAATPATTAANAYQEMFTFASPKFITPTVGGGAADVYKLQIRQFNAQMASQQESRKLRSYMKLYASIQIHKLAAFDDIHEEQFTAQLLSYKHKMYQKEEDPPGVFKSALDIHYYLNGTTVHVDEAEKQRRFENYFMSQITQNGEIRKDIEQISTKV